MKIIYFVRHGESESNTNKVGIGSNPSLTENGRKQAEFVAQRCLSLPIQYIITSTLNRALETAEIINEKIQKPLEKSDLFVERRFPSEYLHITEKEWPDIKRSLKNFFYELGHHHSDEENFEDVIIRGNKALDFILKKKEDHILVVTHGSFLRDMIASAVFKGDLTPEILRRMIKGFFTSNTGLTILGYDENANQWKVLTWNDHAHLG